jgi:hypothetical protein
MFLAFDPAVSRHYEVFLLPEGTIAPDVVKEKIQPRKKVKNIQPQTWIELDVEQLHLPILFEDEQLSEQGQEEIDIKVHSGYICKAISYIAPINIRCDGRGIIRAV